MRHLIALSLVLALPYALPLRAADKNEPLTAEMSDERVKLKATIYDDPEAVKSLIGVDPGFQIVLVTLRFTPRGEEPVKIWRDSFSLLSHKTGEHSQPLSPSQLAGAASIAVKHRNYSGASGMGGNPNGPIWGGTPGTTGRPRKLGDQEAMTSTSSGSTDIKMSEGQKGDNENPLLLALKQKVLPEVEAKDPVEGHLYFLIDGKHKPKDFELIYKTENGGRIYLEFDKKQGK